MPPPESSLLCQLLLCIVAAVYDNFLIVVLVYCYRCAQVSSCLLYTSLFFIEDGLVEMGNAPSLRDIVPEYLCQLPGGRTCNGVPPGAEGHQKLALFIKCHITVHHG